MGSIGWVVLRASIILHGGLEFEHLGLWVRRRRGLDAGYVGMGWGRDGGRGTVVARG